MKKTILFLVSLIVAIVLISCVEVEVKDVTSIELSWQPEEAYEVNVLNVDLSDKSVVVNFEDGTDQTLEFGDESLTIRGDIVGGTHLNTTTVGEKNVKVSYGGVTLDIYYYVADLIVEPGDDITAIASADEDDFVYISSGEYEVTEEISIINPGVTVSGPKFSEAMITSDNNVTVFFIKAADVTVQQLTLTTTFVAPNTSYVGDNYPEGVTFQPTNPALIVVGADGSHINSNTLFGTYSAGYNYTRMTTFGIKPSAAGIGTINADGNTIYNVRQGIQLGSNNIGIITNNVIFHTKGGILSYGKTYEQWQADSWMGNSWESTVAGYEDGNEADMVFHSSGDVPNNPSGLKTWHTFAQVLDLSEDNNYGSVTDRRTNPTDPEYIASGNTTWFNRTHVYIREITPEFAAANPFYEVSQATIAGQKGNIRLPLWDTNLEQSVRVALGLTGLTVEALVAGGTIMVWNVAEGQYEVYPPEDYPSI